MRSWWITLLLAAACSSGAKEVERVSDDKAVQLKYEAARRVLADISERKQLGQSVEADCQTATMLFQKDLERMKAPAATRLAKELTRVCELNKKKPPPY
jgi:hypothetical protein